ncbi:hypothetical protein EFP95_12205 [Lentilactobacillus hilgardii]|nr:hypothetical protein [Lentilactobacillus hilgardii]
MSFNIAILRDKAEDVFVQIRLKNHFFVYFRQKLHKNKKRIHIRIRFHYYIEIKIIFNEQVL